MRFIIPGEPIAKMRHRQRKLKVPIRTKKGKLIHQVAFDPQEKEKIRDKLEIMAQVTKYSNSGNKAIQAQLKCLGESSAFTMDIEFHCSPTKADPWGLSVNCNKKDLDNMIKWVADICNDILYSDDHKIVEIHATKSYNFIPKTIINIEAADIMPTLSKNKQQVLKIFSPSECKNFLEDIGSFGEYSSVDLEVMPEAEWKNWVEVISQKKLNFARKWGVKLKKLADKTKDDIDDIQ